MLRHLANARLAPKHSPLTEQRLVFLQKTGNVIPGSAPESEGRGLVELSRSPELVVRKIGRDTRSHLGFLDDAAGVKIDTLTDAEAEALATRNVNVLQGQQPDLLRGNVRDAVTNVLNADAGKEGSVMELSRETRDMMDALEQLDWKNDAAIEDFYDRHEKLLRRVLALRAATTRVNKTELVLQLRYLPEVDEVLARRRERAEELAIAEQEKKLQGPAVAALIEDLATLNWQEGVQVATALSRHEKLLSQLLAPQTFQARFSNDPYAQLKWTLEQLPQLQARVTRAHIAAEELQFTRLTAENDALVDLTEALAQAPIGDEQAFERIHDKYRKTLEVIFEKNGAFIPTNFSKIDVITWAIQAIPGMAATIERKRQALHEAKEFDEPGCQYLYADEYLEQYRQMVSRDKSRQQEEIDAMLRTPPSAFQCGNTVYFNIDHPESADQIMGPRSAAHELTHFAIRKEKHANASFFADMQSALEQAGAWSDVQRVVRASFGERGAAMSVEEIIEEAAAIYVGGEKAPYTRVGNDGEASQLWEIHHMLAQSAAINGNVAHLLQTISREVDAHYDSVREKLAQSTEQSQYAAKQQREYDEFVRTNAKETEKAKEDATAAIEAEEEEEKKVTLHDVQMKISAAKQACESARASLPLVMKSLPLMSKEQQNEEQKGLDFVRNFLDENDKDLLLAEQSASALERWDLPENKGGLTAKEKEHYTKLWNFGPDEAINKELTTKALNEYVSGVQSGIKEIGEFINRERPTASEKEDKGLWGNLKEVFFSNGKNVEWVSWSDAVKIVGIFKEAIVAKWEQGKERKTHRIADKIAQGSWLAKPIEHTLRKQARAANEKQTSEFADYLKTAGLNFDRLMGRPDGLYWRLGNINEKKAVLEYAAEKAWLYDLSPVNGADVYGIDFVSEFGPEAFSELVQHYEEGKKKESKRGYAKVNQRPDIPPMIEDLIHEMRERNIFAAHGIFQRIQEKAKYTHSHTWAITTFISELRKDPQLLAILDKGLLDDIGNIGIGQTAWSMTMFKLLRKEMMEWKAGARWDNNVLTRAIKKIEERLSELPNGIKEKTKEEAVAIILAGKTYQDGDVVISIFQKDFDEYRKWWKENSQSTVSAAKTDDDFFSPDGSDILLASSTILDELGTRDSTGRPTHQSKLPKFFSMIRKRYDELKKIDPVAKERFRTEMQAKLKNWFRTRICSNAASTGQFPNETDSEGNLVIVELLRRRFLLKEDIVANLKKELTTEKEGKKVNSEFGNLVDDACARPL